MLHRVPPLSVILLSLLLLGWGAVARGAGIVVLDDQADTTSGHIQVDVDPSAGRVRVTADIPTGTEIDSLVEAAQRMGARVSSGHDLDRRYGGQRTSEMVSFGQDITVQRDQIVEGDVVCMFGSVKVDGLVQGSVVAIGGGIRLGEEALVQGDAVSLAGSGIQVSHGSVITGQAVAIGGRVGDVPGARIGDRIELKFIPAFGGPGLGSRGVITLLLLCLHLIFMGLIGLVLVKLTVRRWAASVATLKARGWESLLAGIGAGIVFAVIGIPLMLVVIVALVALVVGIPLVPLVAFLLLIFPLPGYVITATLIGGALRGHTPPPDDPVQAGQGWAYVLGHVMLTLPWIVLLPVSLLPGFGRIFVLLLTLGWGVISLAVAFGWGAFLLSRFGNRFPREEAVPPPSAQHDHEAVPVS